jgi:serine/threonine protein kinase
MTAPAPELDTIFLAAIAIDSAEERACYIARACGGDAELQGRVDRLVQAHFRAGSFLERPAGPLIGTGAYTPSSADTPIPGGRTEVQEGPGTRIGSYQLVQEVGAGGMGTVFLAAQTEPVKRQVALKVIKPGMDSRQVIARFEGERQALALMDHPNIARVLDAGTTESGRPYFVMELVTGVPITKYCDERRLTPKERLELFLPVCQAVQHAHQKGIIHRDLKPSNVLVTLYDGVPVPKVIDFGIARATGPKPADQTLFTLVGQVVGTLEYMSPEQANLNHLDIDTRSDIYSLGVLLYELLTGTTPLDRKRLKEAPFLEVLRLVREEEPPKPSTRLSELSRSGLPSRTNPARQTGPTPPANESTLVSIAATRGLEPKKLRRLVRGELDWIVMKCLEKDRNRRYETANALAADVQRYLADEAVQACPPSPGYRLRKFARRNKRMLATVAIVGLLLVAAVVTLAVSNVRIHNEQLRTKAEYERAEAEAGRAQDNLRLAFEALDETILNMLEDQIPRDPEAAKENQERLTKALGFYEQFARQNEADPKARLEVARAYHRAGQMHRTLGHSDKALAALDRAAEVYEQLIAADPADPEPKFAQAVVHTNKGSLLNDRLGDVKAAQAEYRKGIELIDPLLKGSSLTPDNRFRLAGLHNALGKSFWKSGDPAGAIKYYRTAIELIAAVPAEREDVQHRLVDTQVVANYRANLALALSGASRLQEAEDELRQVIALLTQVYKEASAVEGYRRGRLPKDPRHWPIHCSLASAHNNLAGLLHGTGRSKDAEKEWGESVNYYRQAVEDWPGVPSMRRDLAHIERRFGLLLFDGKKRTEAAARYRHAIDLFRALDADSPGGVDVQVELGESLDAMGDLLLADGDQKKAAEHYREALDLRERVVKRCPGVPEPLNKLAWFLAACPDPSFRAPGRAVELAQEAVNLSKDNGNFWNTLGVAQYRNGAWKAAADSLETARQLRQDLDECDWLFLAMASWQLGEKPKARDCYDRAVKCLSIYEYQPEESGRFLAEAKDVLEIKEPKK